jgi:DnaJ-domain-containing protein 1
MTTTGRRGRLFRRAEDLLVDDDDADLSEDEHAWWAAREGVAAVPRGGPSEDAPAPEGEDDPRFADYWSTESLFDEHQQVPPPPPGEPAPEIDVPGGLDLDAAHLVLQVRIGVTWEEITAAHRRLAKLYHPDRLVEWSPEAQELGRTRMAEINSAHATLRALHFHS